MSLKQYFKVIDTPFAIVVGSVGAVLVTLQLGAAAGVLNQDTDHGARPTRHMISAQADEQMALRSGGDITTVATR